MPTSQVRHGVNRLHNPGRRADCHRKIWNRLCHDAPGANRTALADSHARHDGCVPADPAVIANADTLGILDAVAARLHARLMSGGENRYKGTKLHPVANLDDATIQNDKTVAGKLAHEAKGAGERRGT